MGLVRGVPITDYCDQTRHRYAELTFASGGSRLVATINRDSDDHDIRLYGLEHPETTPRIATGKHASPYVTASPDGKMVVASGA